MQHYSCVCPAVATSAAFHGAVGVPPLVVKKFWKSVFNCFVSDAFQMRVLA